MDPEAIAILAHYDRLKKERHVLRAALSCIHRQALALPEPARSDIATIASKALQPTQWKAPSNTSKKP